MKNLCPNLKAKAESFLLEKYGTQFDEKYVHFEDFIEDTKSPLFLEYYGNIVLEKIKNYFNKKNITFFFVSTPEHPIYEEKIDNLFEKHNIEFYNLSKKYRDYYDEFRNNIKINPANYHTGTRLTLFYATEVFNYLKNNYQEILGEQGDIKMNDIIINDYMPRNIDLNKIDNDTFSFKYPDKNTALLEMPIRKRYVKLNFMYPIDIDSITISGDDIKEADIYFQRINLELGYDDKQVYHAVYNKNFSWNVNSSKVTSIDIHCNIYNNKSSTINIKIKKKL